MSIRVQSEVWQLDVENHLAFLIMAMADHADDDGGNVYPSVAYLAWKTGQSHRSTQRGLKILRDQGIAIQVDNQQRITKQYRLDFTNVPRKPPFKGRAPEVTPGFRQQTIERFSQTCFYCKHVGTGTDGPDGNAWHIDRVIPGSRGGEYTEENVVLACGTCNRSKGAKMAPLGAGATGDVDAVINGTLDKPTLAVPGATVMAPKPSVEPSTEPPNEPSDIHTVESYVLTAEAMNQVGQEYMDPDTLPDWYSDLWAIKGFKKSLAECRKWLSENGVTETRATETAAAVKAKWPIDPKRPHTDAWATFRNWVLRDVQGRNGSRPSRSGKDAVAEGWGDGTGKPR